MLALFAVSGAQKALAFHLNPVAAILLGMLTGIDGGILRDMLVSEVPIVLHSDLYAVAALAGATVVVIGSLVHLPPGTTTIAGALFCFGRDMAWMAATNAATGLSGTRGHSPGPPHEKRVNLREPYEE